jgi:hypothetical protein
MGKGKLIVFRISAEHITISVLVPGSILIFTLEWGVKLARLTIIVP